MISKTCAKCRSYIMIFVRSVERIHLVLADQPIDIKTRFLRSQFVRKFNETNVVFIIFVWISRKKVVMRQFVTLFLYLHIILAEYFISSASSVSASLALTNLWFTCKVWWIGVIFSMRCRKHFLQHR